VRKKWWLSACCCDVDEGWGDQATGYDWIRYHRQREMTHWGMACGGGGGVRKRVLDVTRVVVLDPLRLRTLRSPAGALTRDGGRETR